jgi:hypothetical protein
LVLFDFTAFRLFTFGLETGVYLCSLAVCMLIWRRIVATPPARWLDVLSLGFAAGIAGLSRIDFGLLLVVLLSFLLIKRIASLLQVLAAGLIALALVSPWFAFVHRVSGDWLPSSGKAESKLFTLHDFDRILSVFVSSMAHVVPWSYASAGTSLTTAIGLASLAIVVFLFLRARETRTAMRFSSEFRLFFYSLDDRHRRTRTCVHRLLLVDALLSALSLASPHPFHPLSGPGSVRVEFRAASSSHSLCWICFLFLRLGRRFASQRAHCEQQSDRGRIHSCEFSRRSCGDLPKRGHRIF